MFSLYKSLAPRSCSSVFCGGPDVMVNSLTLFPSEAPSCVDIKATLEYDVLT